MKYSSLWWDKLSYSVGGENFIIIKITTLNYMLHSVRFSGFNFPCPDFHLLRGKKMITVHHRHVYNSCGH